MDTVIAPVSISIAVSIKLSHLKIIVFLYIVIISSQFSHLVSIAVIILIILYNLLLTKIYKFYPNGKLEFLPEKVNMVLYSEVRTRKSRSYAGKTHFFCVRNSNLTTSTRSSPPICAWTPVKQYLNVNIQFLFQISLQIFQLGLYTIHMWTGGLHWKL